MNQVGGGHDVHHVFLFIDNRQRMKMPLAEQFGSLPYRVSLFDGRECCSHDVGNFELLINDGIHATFVCTADQQINFHQIRKTHQSQQFLALDNGDMMKMGAAHQLAHVAERLSQLDCGDVGAHDFVD